MAEHQIIAGAVAPLFDRLRLAKSATEAQPLRAFTRPEVQASVQRELRHLLNTRSPTLAAQFATRTLTVVDYGIPDFTAFAPQNSTDRARMGELITRAITAFEPRLRQVTATVELLAGQPQQFLVKIEAALVVECMAEPVALAAVLPHRGNQTVAVQAVVVT